MKLCRSDEERERWIEERESNGGEVLRKKRVRVGACGGGRGKGREEGEVGRREKRRGRGGALGLGGARGLAGLAQRGP